jgi:hypothetical protein
VPCNTHWVATKPPPVSPLLMRGIVGEHQIGKDAPVYHLQHRQAGDRAWLGAADPEEFIESFHWFSSFAISAISSLLKSSGSTCLRYFGRWRASPAVLD